MPAVVYHRAVPMMFVQSLIESYKAMPHLMPLQASSNALPNRARTMNGRAFLESEAEWIFLIDDDMAWVPASLIQLVQTAKEKKATAVSGFTFMEPRDGRVVPHAYDLVPTGSGGYTQMPFVMLPSMTEPFKVKAVGGACFLVHRQVYEDVLALAQGKTGYPWQEEVYNPAMDAQLGEDLVFSHRIRQAGHDIWYEPRAVFLHTRKPSFLGLKEYSESLERLRDNGVLRPTDV
jgi:GT2 family glycosyltransferase